MLVLLLRFQKGPELESFEFEFEREFRSEVGLESELKLDRLDWAGLVGLYRLDWGGLGWTRLSYLPIQERIKVTDYLTTDVA